MLHMLWLVFVLESSILGVSIAHAQTYPAKPVRVIVPFPPVGAADLLTRTLGQKLAETWGQQFIVENRPGAGGNLGLELVVRDVVVHVDGLAGVGVGRDRNGGGQRDGHDTVSAHDVSSIWIRRVGLAGRCRRPRNVHYPASTPKSPGSGRLGDAGKSQLISDL